FSDYKQNIRFVDARYPGSNHDSHIWNVSTLKQHLDQNLPTNTWILGDAGYPLGRNIMTPFRNTVDGSPQRNYNKIHAKARNSVERTIGVLKSKFRCLLSARGLHYAPEKAMQIVNDCCALHNISQHFKVQFPDTILSTDNQQEPTPEENNSASNGEAETIRNNIMRSLQ
ncbi:PREDICTED: putative nuclease HARBI1, partial [Rhagoletis zephyria]|uniref:putative nuclease HARBI1 n=1 Tax=Rhagoletis zephyria TaxID=28612 RepID=UPI0008112886